MSSGESERVIVPFALVDTGLRWHVRAFDRKSEEFRDFVITRVERPTLLAEESQPHERLDNDIQWTKIVELELVAPRNCRDGLPHGWWRSSREASRCDGWIHSAAMERGLLAGSQPARI